ncbi:protein kinase domain-containing protein [Brevundimonas olei]|uniref:protein kinase domain-containing protein n=1 Tax=Brevundimonas olei TaxID=657642 RepID=UPI0031CEAA58
MFDEAAWSLLVAGRPVELEGKPLQVLHELLLSAGEAVTKAELLDAVWPGVHVVEASLTTAVSKLRGALGEGGADVIQTLPRVGYRLAGPVEVEQLSTPLAPRFAFASGDPVPGRPQWVLEEALGASGADDVWRARHQKVDESRIFKFAEAPDRLRSLRREVALFRLMRNVLGDRRPCVDVLEWNFDVAPYFIEAADAGRDMRAWAGALEGGLAAMPLDRRIAVVADLARAVAAAHGAGVLHKDLKPANVMIETLPSGALVVRLADFGSGWLLDQAALDLHGISGGGFPPGEDEASTRSDTAAYRAPEVAQGRAPGMAADIYALGLILYQMTVGDLDRPLAAGWEGEVDDPLLREDIALAAAGDPSRRLESAALLAEGLDTLEQRRKARAEAEAEAERREVERRREDARATRRPWVRLAVGLGAVGLVATSTAALVAVNQRNEARAQTAAAEASYAFLVDDLLGQANPLSGSAAEETLAAAALRARSTVDARFARQPEVAAGLHLSLATAFVQRGQYDEARRSFALAAAAYERAGLQQSPAAARARLLHARAEALSAQPGGLAAAKTLTETERRRLGSAADKGMLGFHLAQAEAVIGFFEDLDASNAAFARALAIAETRPAGLSDRDVLLVRQQQAVLLMRLGRPAEALPLAQRVAADWARALGPDHANALIARQHVAQARLMTGDLNTALTEADALLPVMTERFGRNSRYTLGLQSTRYEVLAALGRYAEAAGAAEAVWKGAEISQGPNAHQTLGGLNDLGAVQCRTDDRRQGLRHLDQAYRASREGFGDDYPLTHVIRFYLGECLVLDGRYSEAKQLLTQVDRERAGGLVGDAAWGVMLDLALAEIAAAEHDQAALRQLLPHLSALAGPDTPPFERRRHARLVRSG